MVTKNIEHGVKEVLVVEDDQPVASALVKVLQNAGFQAVEFHRGLDALNHAMSRRPMAAVIDIHLPDINGLTLTSELRRLVGDQTPLVILSGDTSIETLSRLPHSGATYFLAKPVQGRALVERLRSWLADAGAR